MTECSICLLSEIDEEEKCTNNCGHSFCKSCLDNWFNGGNISCPLCRQPVDYFEYNSEKFRLIKTSNRVIIPPIDNDNQLSMINKKICKILNFTGICVIGGVLFQAYLIHHLHSKNNELKEIYTKDINKYIKIIDDNNYINLEDNTEVFIFNSDIHKYLKCWIPKYFIRLCF